MFHVVIEDFVHIAQTYKIQIRTVKCYLKGEKALIVCTHGAFAVQPDLARRRAHYH